MGKTSSASKYTKSDNHKEIIIVTGSSGLIGTHLIKRLAAHCRMIGFDRAGDPFPPVEAECVCVDMASRESIQTAMQRVRYGYGDKIASVIHLAAYYDFSGEPSALYEKVTVQGTEKLLKVLQGFKVEQFVFSSTNLVYKPASPGQKIAEDCPVEPNWDYPESKADTEAVIRECRGSIPVVLLRIAGVYDDWGHSIPISRQIQRIYERQFTGHFFSGDLSHGNVFLHMDDLLNAIVRTVEKRKTLPEEIAINIGEAETPSYEELQQAIGQFLHGKEWRTYEVPKPLAKAGAWSMDLFGDPFIKPWMIDRADDHYELDISRAEALLGWKPERRLLDTLPRIIKNLKANPATWYRDNQLDLPPQMGKSEKP